MTAVIWPVSIQYTDLCHRRIPVFLSMIILLDMLEIFKRHRKTKWIIQLFQFCLRHIFKSVKYLYICRFFKYRYQCLRLLSSSFSWIYRIDAVIFDCFKLFLWYISLDHISYRCTDHRCLIFFDKSDTLFCWICSLVKLSRKKFNWKAPICLILCKTFSVKDIDRRLCKHSATCFFKCLIWYIFCVIPDQNPYPGHIFNSEIMTDLMSKPFRCYGKFRLFFHIHTLYITHIQSPFPLMCLFLHTKLEWTCYAYRII